jgi:hypothetical protein
MADFTTGDMAQFAPALRLPVGLFFQPYPDRKQVGVDILFGNHTIFLSHLFVFINLSGSTIRQRPFDSRLTNRLG